PEGGCSKWGQTPFFSYLRLVIEREKWGLSPFISDEARHLERERHPRPRRAGVPVPRAREPRRAVPAGPEGQHRPGAARVPRQRLSDLLAWLGDEGLLRRVSA